MIKQYRRLAIPYIVWLSLLVFIPTIALVILGFTNLTSSIVFSNIQFTFSNFTIFSEISILTGFKNSLIYASLTTIISFVTGYLLAYIIYKSKFKNKFMIMTLMILPMWSNLILRIDGLANIMSNNNILVDLIGFSPLRNLIGTPVGILIGMVFTYVPFMILPIYTALEKIDYNLDEASSDLGLTPIKTFMFVTFPLSFKGVVTGAIMVFLPTFSGFAIPKILSQGNMIFLGNIIENKFTNTVYNDGALLSASILLFIFLAMFLLRRFDKEGETLL
ncbi:MAG: ABC transporter permease [Acholeplasmataceae bacterium]